MRIFLFTLICLLLNQFVSAQSAEFWLTKDDQSVLLAKQNQKLLFETLTNNLPTIEVDETKSFQTIDGFGYTLTGGSALFINKLPKRIKAKLLAELFGKGKDSIAISYLRISIGSSDLDEKTFSYNDLPNGQTDLQLKKFSLSPDKKDLIPILKAILRLSPKVKILASPWSAPAWMKDNNSTVGGSLKPEFYGVYAAYFVQYIRAMKLQGIEIEAITPQNEPLHDGNNPSMIMTAMQQTEFIKNHLGPAFRKAKLKTKIIIYDHNCDKPEYPIEVLNDPDAKKFIDGSAFHLYRGSIGCLSKVREAHSDKNIYFTEQYTASTGDFGSDLKWHVKNIIIGSMRNWSRNALEWNLANDEKFEPHTIGGCTTCKGALTIANNVITRNVSYYIIAHAAKFVPPGSVRIGSNIAGDLQNVAFKTPNGETVLIVENDGKETANFNIKFKKKGLNISLPAGSVGTFKW